MNSRSPRPAISGDLLARILEETGITDCASDCWEWVGNTNHKGYPIISIDGRNYFGHRVMLLFSTGEWHPELNACHHCDSPSCINPRHLYWATQKANIGDMMKRGRRFDNRGEKHPLARIDADAVRAIRRKAAMGHTHKQLAEEYGLARQYVGKVVRSMLIRKSPIGAR